MLQFNVDVTRVVDMPEMEGAWSSADFRSLLKSMDVDDADGIDDDQTREMALMFLQEQEPADAAALLLKHRLGDALTKGQIDNISHEMLEDKLWEQYSDMSLHERLFHVGSMLALAFPRSVPVPDAVQVDLVLRGVNDEATKVLQQPLKEALIIRLLAAGMPPSAPVHRMFGDALKGTKFPEAESIVWIVDAEPFENGELKLQITGSGCWFDALKGTRSYEATAHPDK